MYKISVLILVVAMVGMNAIQSQVAIKYTVPEYIRDTPLILPAVADSFEKTKGMMDRAVGEGKRATADIKNQQKSIVSQTDSIKKLVDRHIARRDTVVMRRPFFIKRWLHLK